jgi:Protein of unknown function (DUF4054)
MDKVAFRAAFPEFTVAVFPDTTVNFWSGLAENLMSEEAWGGLYQKGLFLLTAHYLTMSKIAAASAKSGDSGSVSQRKVGDVSVSFDSQSAGVAGAGTYNRTVHGKAYFTLVNMIGIGAIQL